jgi:hypothetical protein
VKQLLALAAAIALAAPVGSSYSLESRAAIGAHHLCSGLWVVGRVTPRSAKDILAQDIAPFKDFSWDSRFTFRVDAARHAVTVSGPGIVSRTSVFSGDQGCAILPRGHSQVHFTPGHGASPRAIAHRSAVAHRRQGRRRRSRSRLGHGADPAQYPRRRRGPRRQDRRRALRARLDGRDAANQLVGGQEHHRGADRHSRPPRRVERGRCGAGEGSGGPKATRAARFESAICCT